jgi:hypothetical protein
MVTPIQIDQNLLQEALALSNHPTATAVSQVKRSLFLLEGS